MDRSDIKPNERGVSVYLPRHKGDQESATSTNQLNHNAQCPLRLFGGDWARHATPTSALPCALRRCGACIVMLHKTRAPTSRTRTGRSFCISRRAHASRSTSKRRWSAGAMTSRSCTARCPRRPRVRRRRTARSMKTLRQWVSTTYHNRIAADRGWVLLDLVRLSFHAWRHGAIANVFVLKHGELAICIAFHLRSAAVMKHYIAEKLGVLMPGNALANLAGAAVATDHDDEQRCFKYSLAAAFSRVIVSHAQAYELPGVTNDTVVRWWIGHSRRRVLSVRVVCVAIVSTTNAVGGLSTL